MKLENYARNNHLSRQRTWSHRVKVGLIMLIVALGASLLMGAFQTANGQQTQQQTEPHFENLEDFDFVFSAPSDVKWAQVAQDEYGVNYGVTLTGADRKGNLVHFAGLAFYDGANYMISEFTADCLTGEYQQGRNMGAEGGILFDNPGDPFSYELMNQAGSNTVIYEAIISVCTWTSDIGDAE